MLDFLKIEVVRRPKSYTIIRPSFRVCKSKDLMTRGGDFHAIWDDNEGLWSTDEQTAVELIDMELDTYVEENKFDFGENYIVEHMWNSSSGSIDKWHKFVQKQMRDNFHQLDFKMVFRDDDTVKADYATRRLKYNLMNIDTPAYNLLSKTLYSPDELRKLEWAIGSIIDGDSIKLEKFIVLYGAPGTGKSSYIKHVIEPIFDGYYEFFDAEALGDKSNSFSMEVFAKNPLVAIQHDGDLSRITTNIRLNSIVSHDKLIINQKHKSQFTISPQSFLFMGTNKPVKITDAKSGLNRRLIDVNPTGKTLMPEVYINTIQKIKFEIGGIAKHCLDVYRNLGRDYYSDYEPVNMREETDMFYNFILDECYNDFERDDCTTLAAAWVKYKDYCEYSEQRFKLSMQEVKNALKDYFKNYKDRGVTADGERVRNFYSGFMVDKFNFKNMVVRDAKNDDTWLDMKFGADSSELNRLCADCPAQYAKRDGTPSKKWEKVTTKLCELDTTRLHYTKLESKQHIVVDFDMKNENGEKDLSLNLEAANKWPPTYAELSKSGNGVHLHYIYTGNVENLKRLHAPDVEIKVFLGDSSLRRKVTKCNHLQIAELDGGLEERETRKVINKEVFQNEASIRKLILENLKKEHHPSTASSISFIKKILDDAYASGIEYDVSDLRPAVIAFANNSTHQAKQCLKMVTEMEFTSEKETDRKDAERPLVFYDIEVFPNLLLINYKRQGKGKKMIRMINPEPKEVAELFQYNLIGYNNRRYDNHIIYARSLGYSLLDCYRLSKAIIDGEKVMFREAYNVSYTDIYDFSTDKKSLKKWEIELGLQHKELDLDWNEPVPEELWPKVSSYCDNDVHATEAVFEHLHDEFVAREILADIAGMSVNTSTNALTTKIIFEGDKNPGAVYTDLSDGLQYGPGKEYIPGTGVFSNDSNKFEGYSYTQGKNLYRGIDVGFGGWVYAQPGMYAHAKTFDVASMHPSSIIAMNVFGKYTDNFKQLLDIRLAIKRKQFETISDLFGGKLKKYLQSTDSSKALSKALKIAINSVYGLTSASFENAFRDIRNKNNIVALRGALFMKTLVDEVIKMGYEVIHVKTDSIKIANPDEKIENFILGFGTKYGYTFEVESEWDRLCLVNDAVLIGHHNNNDPESPNEWEAVGAQFKVPYVFKTLFSKEKIEFDDLCEIKSVTTKIMLDFNENLPSVELEEMIRDARDKVARGTKITKKMEGILSDWSNVSYEELNSKIAVGHNYQFVGKIGKFCPVIAGADGGLLVRQSGDKYTSVTGAKGYRWMESDVVRDLKLDSKIDISYYDELAENAIDEISKYGDYSWFIEVNDVA